MLIQDTMTKEAWLWRSSSCADSLAQTLYFCLWFYIRKSSFPETNSSPLKINGWKRIVSFWDGLFSGAMLVLGSLTRKLTLLLLGEKALVLENWPFKNRGNLSIYIYIYTYIYILCISYIYIDIYCFIYTREIYTHNLLTNHHQLISIGFLPLKKWDWELVENSPFGCPIQSWLTKRSCKRENDSRLGSQSPKIHSGKLT